MDPISPPPNLKRRNQRRRLAPPLTKIRSATKRLQRSFVKGKSGNPKGRKKAKTIKDIGAALEEILDESVSIREGERLRTMTRLEQTIQALRAKALKGDPKAIRGFLKLAERLGMFTKSPRRSLIEITEPDGNTGEILRMYHAEQDALHRPKDEIISVSCNKPPLGQDH